MLGCKGLTRTHVVPHISAPPDMLVQVLAVFLFLEIQQRSALEETLKL